MNIEEAIESIQSMDVADRRRMIYNMAVDTSADREHVFNQYMWQWIEENSIGANPTDGTAQLEEIAGMMRIAAKQAVERAQC